MRISNHQDNICCYARPGEVLLNWTDDIADPQYERSQKALTVLESSTDARGRRLVVHKVHQPNPVIITPEEAASLEATESGTMGRVCPIIYIWINQSVL